MRPLSAHQIYTTSRRSLAVFALLTAAYTLTAQGNESPPYRAHIVVASAPVLSGPGEQFYPTDTLAEGDTVEVYRQQPNGWCAIRPPDNSFSWVFGRHVRLRDDAQGQSLAEIDKEDVASRIGSRLSSHRNAVQVRLKKGELLRVIGEETTDGETWYKVSPPAGEFRWIQASAIRNIGPIPGRDANSLHEPQRESASNSETAVANAVATELVAAPSHSATPTSNTTTTTTSDSTTAIPPLQQPPTDQWRSAPEKAVANPLTAPPLADSSIQQSIEKGTGVDSTDTQVAKALPTTPVAGQENYIAKENVPNANLPNSSANISANRSLADLELRLSRMVAEPPGVWNTAALRADAEAMLAQAPTLNDRNSIQTTIAKIDRFAAIERRYRGTAGAAPDDGQGFDAIGVLRPVASRRPGAPPFALLDERGQVVSFVTPTPGVNLTPYLGQRIGVNGSRGYIPEFQRGHVVAGRVSPVADRLIR